MLKIIYILLSISLACLSLFADESHCMANKGKWFNVISSNAWIMNDLNFTANCTEITESTTTYDYGKTKNEITSYKTSDSWIFKNRWQADSDKEWYSFYSWNYWDNNILVSKSHLYRERDHKLAWDFITTQDFESETMTENSTYFFPIENRTHKFQTIWTRQGP